MSDTITLRDHSQPCEHTDRAYQAEGHWFCFARCPGGKEITLRIIDRFTDDAGNRRTVAHIIGGK